SALLTLTRPKAANAVSQPLLEELNEKIESVHKDSAIYCTVITGAGEKAFCAGADLKERKGMDENEVITAVKNIGKSVMKLENMTMPVIAALNGAAYGGGLELALACEDRKSTRLN